MPQVSLNTSANPPVTINPQLHQSTAGNSVITWTPALGQTFTFTNVFGLPIGIFTNKQVTGSQISIQDSGQSGYYPYTLVVTSNGVQYSSAPSQPNIKDQSSGPTIHNR